jgi:hypothetical protein
MADKILKPLRYQIVSVTDVLGDKFTINPFDANGNLLPEMTILVDTSIAIGLVELPSIISLNYNWDIKINVVSLTGATNDCQVSVDLLSVDLIGSVPKIPIITNGGNLECSIISDNTWSALLTS